MPGTSSQSAILSVSSLSALCIFIACCRKGWSIGYAVVFAHIFWEPVFCGIQNDSNCVVAVPLFHSFLPGDHHHDDRNDEMQNKAAAHSMGTVRVKVEGNSVTGIDSRLFCGRDHVEQTATQYSGCRERREKREERVNLNRMRGGCALVFAMHH